MNLRVRSDLLVTDPQAALAPRGARETRKLRAAVMRVRNCMFRPKREGLKQWIPVSGKY